MSFLPFPYLPNHKSSLINHTVPLSRGGVARIVPEFCARARPWNGVTLCVRWNKEFLAGRVFSLFNCCTNDTNRQLLSHHGGTACPRGRGGRPRRRGMEGRGQKAEGRAVAGNRLLATGHRFFRPQPRRLALYGYQRGAVGWASAHAGSCLHPQIRQARAKYCHSRAEPAPDLDRGGKPQSPDYVIASEARQSADSPPTIGYRLPAFAIRISFSCR